MQPPTDATKQTLLNLVREKAQGGYEHGGRTGKSLVFDDPAKGTIGVSTFAEGTSLDNPNRMVGINRVEWLGKVYGEQLVTNYFVLKTPDGPHIEKHSHTFDPSKEMLRSGATPKQALAAALNGLQKITEMQRAAKEEDALGLSFVSEQEAKSLVSLVQEAQPYKRI